MGAQTETELKEKKLRVEDALNATKASYPGTRQFNGCVYPKNQNFWKNLHNTLMFIACRQLLKKE